MGIRDGIPIFPRESHGNETRTGVVREWEALRRNRMERDLGITVAKFSRIGVGISLRYFNAF